MVQNKNIGLPKTKTDGLLMRKLVKFGKFDSGIERAQYPRFVSIQTALSPATPPTIQVLYPTFGVGL